MWIKRWTFLTTSVIVFWKINQQTFVFHWFIVLLLSTCWMTLTQWRIFNLWSWSKKHYFSSCYHGDMPDHILDSEAEPGVQVEPRRWQNSQQERTPSCQRQEQKTILWTRTWSWSTQLAVRSSITFNFAVKQINPEMRDGIFWDDRWAAQKVINCSWNDAGINRWWNVFWKSSRSIQTVPNRIQK